MVGQDSTEKKQKGRQTTKRAEQHEHILEMSVKVHRHTLMPPLARVCVYTHTEHTHTHFKINDRFFMGL